MKNSKTNFHQGELKEKSSVSVLPLTIRRDRGRKCAKEYRDLVCHSSLSSLLFREFTTGSLEILLIFSLPFWRTAFAFVWTRVECLWNNCDMHFFFLPAVKCGVITDVRVAAADCATRMRGDSIQSRSIVGREFCRRSVPTHPTPSRRIAVIDPCSCCTGVIYDEPDDPASSAVSAAAGRYRPSLDSPGCSLNYLLSF